MKHFIDPFDSLGPARRQLIVIYLAVLGFGIVGALAVLYITPGELPAALFPANILSLPGKAQKVLGFKPNVVSRWRDPIGLQLLGIMAAILVAAFVLGYLMERSGQQVPRGLVLKPAYAPFAVAAILLQQLLFLLNLRRLSFLAAHPPGQLGKDVAPA